MTNCPTHRTIHDYIDGRLSVDEARTVGEHISQCHACKAIVSQGMVSVRKSSVETAVTEYAPASSSIIEDEQASKNVGEPSNGDRAPRLEMSEWSMVSDRTDPSTGGDLNMLKAGSKLAHYVITRLIGRGGMGEVYLARDTHLGRKVALKVIVPTQLEHPEALDRFLQEARMTARFNHPNIITIYGVGVVDGFPYVALEYLEGQNLQERCREERPTLQESLRFCLSIGEAVTEAHRHGVLHRDLKPANVLIPKDGRIRVADFGLAQQVDVPDHRSQRADNLETQDGSTPPKKVVGTPAYMAPEQWRAQATSKATDVWALGIMLHELVAGQRPYAGLKAMQLGYQVCRPEPAPVGTELAGAPPAIEALVRQCLAKNPAERPSAAHFTEVIRELVTRGKKTGPMDESPFRGLFPFSERHADMFFGRDDEIASCIERLRYEATLAIIGPSGAGKTSFVQAGLIPRLREMGGRWTVIRVRPGEDPLRRLASKIVSALADESGSHSSDASNGGSVSNQLHDLSQAQSRLDEIDELTSKIQDHPNAVNIALAQVAEQRESRVLLLIDQLEELFTLCSDDATHRAFIQAIASAADEPSDPVRLLCTLRDDFLGHMARLGQISRPILERVAVMSTPTPEALKDILIRPMLATGYEFDDPRLADDMVAAVDDAASLPLLQFAARSLWERRDQVTRTLRRADYEAMGGVEGALARHADSVLNGLSEDELRAARALLLRLVTPENTRRTVTETDLLAGLPVEAITVYDRLTKSRLVSIRKGRSKDGGGSRLELAHESLVVNWTVLADWISESREELVFLAEVGQAAALWERRGRRAEELWVGDGLIDAEATLARTTTETPAHVAAFLSAGRQLRDRRIRRRRFWSTSIPLALSIVAIIFALQKNEAEVAQKQSEQQRRQAVMERTVAEDQRQQARRRQVEAIVEGAQAAYDRGAYQEARAKLRSALELSDGVTPSVRGLWWQLKNIPVRWTQPYGSAIYSLRFAHHGKLGAAATQAGGVYLFDTLTGEGRVLRGHGEQIVSIAFSGDDHWLVSAGYGDKVDIWDVSGGRRLRSLPIPGGLVVSVRFSPNKRFLAAATSKGIVRVWRTTNWSYRDSGPDDAMLRDIAVDDAGKVTALRIRDNTLQITGAHAGDVNARLLTLPNHSIGFYLSENGHRAVSMTKTGIVRIWDTKTGIQVSRFSGGSGDRMGINLSHDGQRVAIAGADGLLRVYDATTSRLVGEVQGTPDASFTLGLSKRGDQLLFSEMRGELHLANVGRMVNLAPNYEKVKAIYGVAMSPSGAWIASMTRTGQVRLWQMETGQKHPLFKPTDHGVPDAFAFSPNERYLAWADKTHRVRLWDLMSMTEIGELEKHVDTVRALGFSPDSKVLKTIGWDGFGEWNVDTKALIRFTKARIPPSDMAVMNAGADRALLGYGRAHLSSDVWSSRDGRRLTAFRGHTDAVFGIALNQSGTWAVTGGWDGRLLQWRTDNGKLLQDLGKGPRVNGAALSPDDQWVAVAYADKKARLHSLASGPVVELKGHASEVNHVAYDGAGERVVTGGDDGTVRTWRSRDGRPLWSTRAFLATSAKMLNHRGWLNLSKNGPTQVKLKTAWSRTLRDESLYAVDGPLTTPWLCAHMKDKRLHLWHRIDDRLIWNKTVPSIRQLMVIPDGCLVMNRQGLIALNADGSTRSWLSNDALLGMSRSGDDILVWGPENIRRFDMTGTLKATYPSQSSVTAAVLQPGSTESLEYLLVGYRDGSLERFPIDGRGMNPKPDMTDRRALAAVTKIIGDEHGHIVVGYADGRIGLWDTITDRWLANQNLHGEIQALAMQGNHVYIASDLGQSMTWDLSTVRLDHCSLLRAVWADVPFVWNAGMAVPSAPPEKHRCAR